MSAEGVSFLDALRGRYGAEDDISSYDPSAFLVGDKSRRRNKTWELVGMEKTRVKQSHYHRLVDVVLKKEGITVAVKPSEVRQDGAVREGEKEAYPDDLAAQRMVSLKELDLSENTELPLAEVARLIPYFPRLDTLQLSDMPALLPPFAEAPSAPPLTSPHLRKLVLNNVGFRSMVQLRLLLDTPALEELHLDSNDMADLVLCADDAEEALLAAHGGEGWLQMPSVRVLSLARNKISSWERLGATVTRAFPSLEKLFLTANALPNLFIPDLFVDACAAAADAPAVDSAAPALAAAYAFLRPLTLLCLNENATITSTKTVDAIRVLCPRLEVFRITYSALLPRWNDTLSRMYVVAAMPTIQLLNRGQVRPKERLDSEIFYVQRGLAQAEGIEAARKEGGEAAVAKVMESLAGEPTYPLLPLLREKHKDLVLSIYREGATASSDGSSHLMLDVRLRCENNYKAMAEANSGNGSGEIAGGFNMFNDVRKTLPSSLTVAKLKALVKVAFQVDPQNQEISYRSGDEGVLDRPVEMDNELQTLGFYGVCNGAIITVVDTSLR